MILIAYDGSEDAKAAIQHAGTLMPGTPATVLTIWEPFTTMLARTPATLRPLARVDADEIDRQETDAAEESAKEAVQLARAAGLDATSFTTPLRGSTADTIIEQADRLDVDAIVVGSRGLTGVRSLLLGSVSLSVVQDADRTVVIVPSADVAEQRQRDHDQ
jgi:nucleotide-binding universal stress UspA family protein